MFLCPDLLHVDYPDSLSSSDIEYRHNLFLKAKEKADIFLTVSNFSRRRLSEEYQIPHRKVWTLPHALPYGVKKKSNQSCSAHTPHFLYPANFWKHKNHKTLMVAYKRYLQRSEKPWKLVLTGHPDSGDSQEIVSLIHSLGLSEHVEYHGYLEGEAYEIIWKQAGALLFPSNYEGFGLPLLEAMDWGLPIIASNIESLKEVAQTAALYIDQHSPEAISKAMLEISNDEALRARLIVNGHNRLKAFSWKQSADTFSKLALNLIGKKKIVNQ
jgi:glycosyltransferase involved in cell wall biosynthesis